jgi:ATP-dependent DNA helicase RecG
VYIFQDRVEIVNPGGLAGGLTVADLGKRSAPRNPLLFGVLYRMGLVEHIGSGMSRIRDALAAEGCADAVFDVNEHWFTIAFPRVAPGGTTKKTTKKTTEKTTEKTADRIVALLRREPQATISGMSGSLSVSRHAVDWHIRRLRAAGRIRRIGPDKGGSWEVLE